MEPRETAKQAAGRLFGHMKEQGYEPTGLYSYSDGNGTSFYRVRMDRDDDKFIRPFHFNGTEYVTGEPDIDTKPLYQLDGLHEKPDSTVYVVEGEKCVDALIKVGLTATTSGASSSAGKFDWSPLQGRDVIIWPDNDESGARYAADVLRALPHARVIDVDNLNLPEKGDCVDWLEKYDVTEIDSLALIEVPPSKPKYIGLNVRQLLTYNFPVLEQVLEPWLLLQGLVMIYGPRGIAKTWLALNIGIAIARGGSFLNWTAPKPRKVLYLDGEMAGATMQERTASIVAGLDQDFDVENFILLTPDVQDRAMFDLSAPEDQEAIKEHTDNADVIIVDNISTLCRTGVENKAEDWLPVQTWMLRMRREGRTVLLLHHGGKGGAQRGTSKREDILNTVIKLSRSPDYTPEQGADFEIHFEKARDFNGEQATPLHVSMTTVDNVQLWEYETLEVKTYDRVVELHKEGLSQKEIAAELEIHKSRVSRHLKRARELNLTVVEGGKNREDDDG